MARHNLGKKIDANGTLNDLGNTVSDDDLTKIDNLDNTYLPLAGGTLNYQAQIKAGTSVFKDLCVEAENLRVLSPTKEGTTATKIATLDSTGYIKYRTPAEIKSDMGVEIGAAGKLGVDTAIGDSPTNAKLPTSLAVANYLESKGLVTPSDLENTYMKKANPVGTGSLSLNRKANTTVGKNSVALGLSPTASGNYSFSVGIDTVASGFSSFAQGDGSQSQGSSSAAIGLDAIAKGDCSQAIGYGVESTHLGQHVFGAFNVLDTSTASKSSQGTYIEIVGNGNKVLSTGAITRSNARTLDWDGNEVLAGTLTTGGVIYEGGNSLANKYLGKTATASNSSKLNNQDASYYLNYNNFTNRPTIPTVNNGVLTIKRNNASLGTFTANQSGNTSVNIEVPTSYVESITKDNENQYSFMSTNGTTSKINTIRLPTDYVKFEESVTVEPQINELLEKIYPIGSIYMSVNNVSPASFLGGTWERIQDRFLLGAGSSYSAGSTGGNTTHLHEVMTRSPYFYGVSVGEGVPMVFNYDTMAWGTAWKSDDIGTDVVSNLATSTKWVSGVVSYASAGTTSRSDWLPPYLAVHIFKRIA